MIADIANGIGSPRTRTCAAASRGANGWAGWFTWPVCVALYFKVTTMALTGGFTMVLVATTPLSLPWPVAFFFVIGGLMVSVSMEGAPASLYGWHATRT